MKSVRTEKRPLRASAATMAAKFSASRRLVASMPTSAPETPPVRPGYAVAEVAVDRGRPDVGRDREAPARLGGGHRLGGEAGRVSPTRRVSAAIGRRLARPGVGIRVSRRMLVPMGVGADAPGPWPAGAEGERGDGLRIRRLRRARCSCSFASTSSSEKLPGSAAADTRRRSPGAARRRPAPAPSVDALDPPLRVLGRLVLRPLEGVRPQVEEVGHPQRRQRRSQTRKPCLLLDQEQRLPAGRSAARRGCRRRSSRRIPRLPGPPGQQRQLVVAVEVHLVAPPPA